MKKRLMLAAIIGGCPAFAALGNSIPSKEGTSTPLSKPFEEFSLFFTSEELENFQKNPSSQQKTETKPLCLQALFFTAPDRWHAWINGYQLSPALSHPLVTIVSVSPYGVTFTLSRDNTSLFCLKTHQCLDLDLQKIQEMAS